MAVAEPGSPVVTMPAWAAWLVRTVLLAGLYVAAAKGAFALAFVHTSIAPVWPPSGIALAAILLFGYRVAPGVLAGALVFNATTPVPLWVAAVVAAGNTLEALAGVWLLRRGGFRPAIDRVGDVLALTGLAALAATAISASAGVGALRLAGLVPPGEVASSWAIWWLGDASGVLAAAPPLLLWANRRGHWRLRRARLAEAVALAALLALSVWAVLAARSAWSFLIFPALVWAAVRFGPAGAAVASLSSSAVVIWATAHGHGPFAEPSLPQGLLLTQGFTIVVMATSLFLAALTLELKRATQALREREGQFAQAQVVAQLGSFEWDMVTGEVTWSPGLYRIYGLDPGSFGATFESFLAQVHPGDRERVAGTIGRSARDGTPFRLQERIIRPDGEERVLVTRGEVALDEHGRPVRMLGVCQDMTESRRREAQLVEARAQAELSRRLERGLLPVLSLRDQRLLLRTRYRPGHERALLGADFYDAIELPDGTVATLVGDVAGHGPDEAAVGVALRVAWGALVRAGHGPGELLDGLDKALVANRPSEEVFTTVCCTWVHPGRRSLTMAIAGHPPPLLIEDGRAEPVRVTSGPALGISDLGHTWPSERIEVGSAWMLLCYTDGLIEGLVAPDSAERFGTKRLVEEVGDLLVAAPDVDAMLDGLLDTVRTANGGDLSDDVAILCLSSAGLAIQRPGPEPSA